MDGLNYRLATRADLPKIVEIYNSTIPSRIATADMEPVTVESRVKWFDDHTGNRPLWVVEAENTIVGWVSFQSFYGRPAYNGTVEVSIYVDAENRGKGLGKQILTYCMDHAPKYQIKTLLGFIFAHNEPSLKLFRSFGFEEWGYLPGIAEMDNLERGLKIVGKRIEKKA